MLRVEDEVVLYRVKVIVLDSNVSIINLNQALVVCCIYIDKGETRPIFMELLFMFQIDPGMTR